MVSSSSYAVFSGFSLRKIRRIIATKTPKQPVVTKFHTNPKSLSANTLSTFSEMMLPTIAFVAIDPSTTLSYDL